MEENRVKTNYLETNYDMKTPSSYILLNKQNNSRTVISTEINTTTIKKYDYDTNIDCVIMDGYEYNASIYACNKFSNAITILNAKTPHNGLLDYFKYVKYVVASSSVAEAITGLKIDFNNPATMSTIYKKIVDKYPHITLLITMEEKGTIYAVNNEIKVLATMNAETVDKTGARDIFIAMIAYGLTNGYDMETAIRLATIAEAMSKKTVGSTLSIPILSDVIQYYESKFGSLQKDTIVETTTPIAEPTIVNTAVNETITASQTTVEPQVQPETPKTDEQIVSQVFGGVPNDNGNNNAPTA